MNFKIEQNQTAYMSLSSEKYVNKVTNSTNNAQKHIQSLRFGKAQKLEYQ